jgi:glutamine---fructose-6-phosphate transaminase (isomerizing)
MCGIFGLVAITHLPQDNFEPLLRRLFLLSESRGKDASGLALADPHQITVLKQPERARTVINSGAYHSLLTEFSNGRGPHVPLVIIGHTRMVTNGSEENHFNNQPVIKQGMVCLHNGIVVNDRALWDSFPQLQREYEIDTEVILSLVAHYRQAGHALAAAVSRTFQHLQGANSVALLPKDVDALVLATSNGSLYFARSPQILVFASERYILEQTLADPALAPHFANIAIVHVQPGTGYVIPFATLDPECFALEPGPQATRPLPMRQDSRVINDINAPAVNPSLSWQPATLDFSGNDQFVAAVNDAVRALRRCSRCLLPETFPFITFDEQGVCNYCHHYTPRQFAGEAALAALVEPRRKPAGQHDCLVPLSGGRDSSYGLHYIKTVLKMHPVAYTYDWGMVTDLARRNISRLCGALGIEHILVSADIRKKRANIRQNVTAWLKRPDLGTVPLFMAGDKQFFYYANMLKKQMQLNMTFFSQNDLERTDFKSGFCGIDEHHQKQIYWNLSLASKFQLVRYYGQQFLRNPAYINSSMLDTLGGFVSYYFIPREFTLLYHYIDWDEALFNATLQSVYDWETATDTNTTWRIGDGTAPFYNYIYYTLAGFSENDTFRSNQIREGIITREEGLVRIESENQPRYESMQWYCDRIGIDLHEALKVINAAPKLYPQC